MSEADPHDPTSPEASVESTIHLKADDREVPAGVAHRFESTGEVPLRQLSLHLAPEMVTEWLEGER